MQRDSRRALGLAAFIGSAGVMHFVQPAFFDAIVPDWMPGEKRRVTQLSGVAELTSAVLVACPRTRKFGALVCLLTFLGVFPANVQSALDGGIEGAKPPMDSAAAVWLRLPLQFPMFRWAWRVYLSGLSGRVDARIGFLDSPTMDGPLPPPAAAVLVPVKAFTAAAKARLAGPFSPDQRARLAQVMAERVVAAGAPLPVFVVCDDAAVRAWAERLGASVIWSPGRGLNGAVTDGVASLAEQGYERVVVAHADLPYATSLAWLATGTELVTIVPDRHDDGTNVISVPARSGFGFSYGPSSCRNHVAEAGRLGLSVRIERDEALGWDVDLPRDLGPELAAELGVALPRLEEPCP